MVIVVAKDPRINLYQMAADSYHYESNPHNKIIVFKHIKAQKGHQHDPSKEYRKHSVSRINKIKLLDATVIATAAQIQTALRVHHYLFKLNH